MREHLIKRVVGGRVYTVAVSDKKDKLAIKIANKKIDSLIERDRVASLSNNDYLSEFAGKHLLPEDFECPHCYTKEKPKDRVIRPTLLRFTMFRVTEILAQKCRVCSVCGHEFESSNVTNLQKINKEVNEQIKESYLKSKPRLEANERD